MQILILNVLGKSLVRSLIVYNKLCQSVFEKINEFERSLNFNPSVCRGAKRRELCVRRRLPRRRRQHLSLVSCVVARVRLWRGAERGLAERAVWRRVRQRLRGRKVLQPRHAGYHEPGEYSQRKREYNAQFRPAAQRDGQWYLSSGRHHGLIWREQTEQGGCEVVCRLCIWGLLNWRQIRNCINNLGKVIN